MHNIVVFKDICKIFWNESPIVHFSLYYKPYEVYTVKKLAKLENSISLPSYVQVHRNGSLLENRGKKWSIPLSKLDETSQWRCSWRDNSHRLLARSWSLTAQRHRLACSPYYNKQLPSGGWRKKQVVNGQVKTRMYLGFLKVVPGWWRDRSHLWHSHHTVHRKNGATSWFRFEIEWTP